MGAGAEGRPRPAEDAAGDEREERRGESHRDGDAGPVEEAREDVPPEVVRAEEVDPVGGVQARATKPTERMSAIIDRLSRL